MRRLLDVAHRMRWGPTVKWDLRQTKKWSDRCPVYRAVSDPPPSSDGRQRLAAVVRVGGWRGSFSAAIGAMLSPARGCSGASGSAVVSSFPSCWIRYLGLSHARLELRFSVFCCCRSVVVLGLWIDCVYIGVTSIKVDSLHPCDGKYMRLFFFGWNECCEIRYWFLEMVLVGNVEGKWQRWESHVQWTPFFCFWLILLISKLYAFSFICFFHICIYWLLHSVLTSGEMLFF